MTSCPMDLLSGEPLRNVPRKIEFLCRESGSAGGSSGNESVDFQLGSVLFRGMCMGHPEDEVLP